MDDRHPNHRSPNDSPEGEAAFGGAHMHGEELLGHLDGECSPAEVAEIEARLEASSELRQLAEEMRRCACDFGATVATSTRARFRRSGAASRRA